MNTPSALSYAQVQKQLRDLGIVLSRPAGRYRVNFFGGVGGTARYTMTLQEALHSGSTLAATRKGPAW